MWCGHSVCTEMSVSTAIYSHSDMLLEVTINNGNKLNTFRPVLVLVPSSLSRQLTDLGTSTKTIFKSLLKRRIGSICFWFVPFDPSMFVVSETVCFFPPSAYRA